jgi:hypothetical protein
MARRPSPGQDKEGFGRFFIREVFGLVLGLAQEARRVAEAAAGSKWVTWWICSVALGGTASVLIKGHLLH